MFLRRKSQLLNRRRKATGDITPDNIFLDSKNLPQFDEDQFEGRIEKSITKNVGNLVGIFFTLIMLAYLLKIGNLQIVKGVDFLNKSENNHLQHSAIFSERGIIYDRNGKELAFNSPYREVGQDFFKREYADYKGLAHIIGHVSYPLKDKSGNYYQDECVGKVGVEKFFNDRLSGKKGLKII